MSAYFELTNQTLTILAFILVLTMTLVMIGYRILYPKTTGLLYFILGNISQLGFFVVLYIDGYSGILRFPVLVNIFECLAASLWVVSFKKITHVKVRKHFYISLNIISTVSTVYYFYFDNSVAERRFFTSLIVAVILIDGAITVFASPSFRRYRSFIFTGITVVLFAMTNLIRGLYRLFVPITFHTIFDANSSISFFVTLTLAFALFMNFSIVFLNMDFLIGRIREMSNIDPLTGIHNRRYFLERFEEMIELLRRKGDAFVIAILDIDDFKSINDSYGHNIGDEMLVAFAAYLKEAFRKVDLVARYGGEEFIVLLRAPDREHAEYVFDRVLDGVRQQKWTSKELDMTFSGGVEIIDRSHLGMSEEEMIDIVDQRLYYAKETGKDKIVYSAVE